VIGQDAACRALSNALDTGRLHHAYLLTGTRGVGKTTLARILAKCLNCEQGVSSKPCGTCVNCRDIDEGRFIDLLEIDAASRTKVEDMRGLLDNVQYVPTRGRFKIYLIDEVHMLSGHSFNALLKTLEEPPAHVKFLLATTDPQKLPITVISRCLQFHLHPVPVEIIVPYIGRIVEQENAIYEPEAIQILGRAAEGSVRDALSLLDQALAYGNGHLKTDDVRSMLGLSRAGCLIALVRAVTAGNAASVLHEINEIKRLAKTDPDFSCVLTELLTLLHHIAIAQHAPEALEEGLAEYQAILELANHIPSEELQLYYQIALMGRKDLPYAPDPKMGFEMIMLRMVAFRPVQVAEQPLRAQSVQPVPTMEPVIKAEMKLEPEITLEIKPKIEEKRVEERAEAIDWNTVIPQLNLSGLVKMLADHCTLAEWSDNFIRLILEEAQKPLWNKRNEGQLQEALSRYVKREIKLQITVGKAEKETPAHQQQRVSHEEQQVARASIENDPQVQKIMNRFNAKIEQINRLTPLENES
jgi:DNA polymerase-3 subunit gamma/tau